MVGWGGTGWWVTGCIRRWVRRGCVVVVVVVVDS